MTSDNSSNQQATEADEILAPVESSAIRAIEGAAYDVAVATAHRYPRKLHEALAYAKTLATMDLETAESLEYAIKRDGKVIKGPSIRCAEILATSFGNIAVAARVVDIGPDRVIIQGVAHDLERNNRQSVEVIRSIRYSKNHATKPGQRFGEDMIQTICLAAIAVARRNAIYAVIPRSYASNVIEAGRQVVAAKGAGTHKARVDQAVNYCLQQLNLDEARVLLALNVKARTDITPERLDELRGMVVAVKDEGEPLDNVFPPRPERKGKAAEKPAETPKTKIAEQGREGEVDFDAMTGEVKE